MTRVSLLATLLFIIYSCGSMVMYVELFNFTVLLYSVTLPKKHAFLTVLLFCLLLLLVYGIQLWTLMYALVFPSYTLIYHLFGKRVKSEYFLAVLGFVLAFLCGTLIDLPFMMMSQQQNNPNGTADARQQAATQEMMQAIMLNQMMPNFNFGSSNNSGF